MITAEEAKRQSTIAIEKQKEENFNFIIEDIDKEIQKAIKKGYTGIYYDTTRLVNTTKVKEYFLSYGYLCNIINEMGNLIFRIDWKEPELGRKEYELIRANAKLSQLLFEFDELEVK